jgi:hypothetical protein
LEELNLSVSKSTRYSQPWPKNPSAMSKQFRKLRSALKMQGVRISFPSRRKYRLIAVTTDALIQEGS